MKDAEDRPTLTANHWGTGLIETEGGKLARVKGHPDDPSPSPINGNVASSLNGEARILRPAVRKGWLDARAGKLSKERGKDDFVEMEWGEVIDLIAGELTRVRTKFGNEAIFGGSYGWSSAGRFHHSQSQLKRFLNSQGGFVNTYGNYSYMAGMVIMPHVVGDFRWCMQNATRLSNIAKHSDLVVMFGGMAERNGQVSDGGVSRHKLGVGLKACAEAGVKFISVTPYRSDAMDDLGAEWLAPNPGSDVALMMGVAQTLVEEGLHDKSFLDRYCVGFEQFEAYLGGKTDGTVKSADWAEKQCGLPAERIRALARQIAQNRTMITCAIALQRADYGEQPVWMTAVLGAMVGQIGLPGGGFGIGYAMNGSVGVMGRPFSPAALPQGENPVSFVLPVAMVTEMLMKPGEPFDFDGTTATFPDIRLVWWAGGNPFHHHQDLNLLREAFQRPETIIVSEVNWTATARHADIVLPSAASPERTDFAAGKWDNGVVPMPACIAPPGEIRTEFDVYAAIAAKMGNEHAFTEGRDEAGWLRHLWDKTRTAADDAGLALPDWDAFISGDIQVLPDPMEDHVFLADFRADPVAHPLQTPSGLIEIFSEVIDGFGYDDCAGHPTWYPPRDVARGKQATFPLYLISGQPATRLHSQLDNGDYSLSRKVAGREAVMIHPSDAEARGISDGDIVELFNDRGRCFAGAKVTDAIKRGCVFLPTGAWYDPDFTAPQDRDRHGNPNVLTHDARTSRLGQGPASHSALIELARFEGEAPEITVHQRPIFIAGR
ncbi:MAG: molybdopterin-dependent oxidoreductase [Pseudomonadota bacterium]